MAYVKKDILDKFEVVGVDTGLPSIQCRHKIFVQDDETGEMVGGYQLHRHVVHPDTDVSSEDAVIQALAASLFTDEVKAAWAAKNAPEEVPAE